MFFLIVANERFVCVQYRWTEFIQEWSGQDKFRTGNIAWIEWTLFYQICEPNKKKSVFLDAQLNSDMNTIDWFKWLCISTLQYMIVSV